MPITIFICLFAVAALLWMLAFKCSIMRILMYFPTFIAITSFQLLCLENLNNLKSLRKPEHFRYHGFRLFFSQFLQLKEGLAEVVFQKAKLPCFLRLPEHRFSKMFAFQKNIGIFGSKIRRRRSEGRKIIY